MYNWRLDWDAVASAGSVNELTWYQIKCMHIYLSVLSVIERGCGWRVSSSER